LSVTDAAGRVIHRAQRPDSAGDSLADDYLIKQILRGGNVVSGTMAIPVALLQNEGPWLAERARVLVRASTGVALSERGELNSGTVLCAAASVRGSGGELVGVLRAGVLVNRSYDLVDRIEDIVFGGGRYKGKLLGVVSITQGDVRISTTLVGDDGNRAVGTRLSKEVYDHVLQQGEPWVGRVWKANDWYIAACAPLHDIEGRVVGATSSGVQAREFGEITVRTLTVFVFVTTAGLLAAALVAWKLAASISRPVRSLADASRSMAGGDFSQMVPVQSTDEIGSLTQSFNRMAESLRERDELLKEQTRLQLTRSERLAAVGRLAAGVAHEINNPLTGVLTFAHMLLENAPENSEEKEDIQTIIDATIRCRDIVRGLLSFSRRNQPQKSLSDLNKLVREALNLTENQARINHVNIIEEMDLTLPHLVIDPNQIQEVAVNAILNAIDAMPDGGDLTVGTRLITEESTEWAELEVSDTGCGIPPEDLERVFDPFFTTKKTGEGTGLGLAVSYGIVTEHGGRIDLASQVGQGTTVTVRLPATRREEAHE